MAENMIVELMIILNQMVAKYGISQTWLIISFLFSIPVFIATVLSSLVIKKIKAPLYFLQFILVQLFAFLFLVFELWYYHSIKMQYLTMFFEPATYAFAIFVFPLSQAYQLMDSYPMLPWHLMQYLMSLIGSLAFWALLIFVFRIVEAPPVL